MARSRLRRAGPAASATTRSSGCPCSARRRPSWSPSTRTASATEGGRLPGCSSFSRRRRHDHDGARGMSAVLRDARGVHFDVLPPLALYIHLPWCVRKCPYCDFNSHERSGALPESEYVAALFRDLEALLPSVWGRRLHSIFIGGGTPSLFSAPSIDALLAGVRARLLVEPEAE